MQSNLRHMTMTRPLLLGGFSFSAMHAHSCVRELLSALSSADIFALSCFVWLLLQFHPLPVLLAMYHLVELFLPSYMSYTY